MMNSNIGNNNIYNYSDDSSNYMDSSDEDENDDFESLN
jgi:hypothetical protein